ncbi:hypothetical protein [Microbulbifer sp. JTAC008]|uniref:hypothetical protein n=1 Tax=unclassified Microbulbifer TaxID=2619833 RepID=UPI00403A3ABF
MSVISKVLVQQTRLDIFNFNRATQIDMKGWIANQNYHVDIDLTSNNYAIRAADKNYLKAALANDCNRMAAAAIESISGVKLDATLNKSGAWGVIRAYYATFFAIHSIMRMYGISCSQLDQAHVDKIFESASAVNKTGDVLRLDKGFYAIKIDDNFSGVTFHKYKDSHKDTWGEFLSLIESLISNSANVTALGKHKVEAIDILLAVKRGITRSRCGDKGNWLSVMRNSVNYQHSHGVWFPYGRKPAAPNYISAIAKDWINPVSSLDTGLNGGDIKTFFDLVVLINSILRELLISCAEKVNSKNPVFTNGSLRLLNTIQAA